MRHTPIPGPRRALVLRLEHLRIISGGTDPAVPAQTAGSTAASCQSTKFNCC